MTANPIPRIFKTVNFSPKKSIARITATAKLRPLKVEATLTFPNLIDVIRQ